MPKKMFFATCLIFFLIFSIHTHANPSQELATSEFARLAGIYDPIKILISEPAISLQIVVYRNENPVVYEDLDPDYVAEPFETVNIGKMELYPEESEEKIYLLFALQNLRIQEGFVNIIHWGLKREGLKSEGMGHSSFKFDFPEYNKPEYDWTFGLFPGIELTSNSFSPIYIIKGGESSREFSSYYPSSRDDLNKQAQLNQILIVIKGSLGI